MIHSHRDYSCSMKTTQRFCDKHNSQDMEAMRAAFVCQAEFAGFSSCSTDTQEGPPRFARAYSIGGSWFKMRQLCWFRHLMRPEGGNGGRAHCELIGSILEWATNAIHSASYSRYYRESAQQVYLSVAFIPLYLAWKNKKGWYYYFFKYLLI